jgi:GAF domain-containing protein/HAMP domain-containing protein
MNNRSSLDRLLKRTGGRYIIIVVAVAQLLAVLGALPGLISIRLNVEFNEELSLLFSRLLPVLGLVNYLLLLGIGWQITRTARKRLDDWSRDTLRPNPGEELSAWREITSLVTRYGISAASTITIFLVLPTFLVTFTQRNAISPVLQTFSVNSPAPIYILLGGLASMLGAVILALLIIERFTLPPRLVLLPNDFETQLKGRAGALFGTKFQALILGLIVIGLAIIVPVGYQQVIRILYSEVTAFQVFRDLQNQFILLGFLALVMGIGYSHYATRSVSNPIRELIETLQKIEEGDLSPRVPVSATDELATVAMHFNRMVSRLDNLQSTLEQQVAERTKQLTATNEVGRVASSILDPDELLAKVIQLITKQFDYYHAAIYLLDPSEKWAELKEATGDTGKVLKQNHYRLEVAGKSMVAACIREKMPRIAQNTAEEKQRYENPLLPYTRSEIALPLIVGDRVLGALNVQSTRVSDFDLEVVQTMQNMVGQVSISLENARLFQEAQQRIREMRAIQQQYLLEGWSGSLALQKEELEYGIGDETDAASQKIEIPINLRDQILGQIMLERNDEWTPEQQSLVDAVATQAAIALENARLVAESRQIAARERMVAEINSRIWSSTTIEGVLQTVVKELGRRLDASQATIELNVEDEMQPDQLS